MSDREEPEDLEEPEEPEGEPDPYTVLRVRPEATPAEVRRAYLHRLREHPPERDPEGFKRVREAYETLRSPRKRAELALLELRWGPAEFDLSRLRDSPPPPVPDRHPEHLLAIALSHVDAGMDDLLAAWSLEGRVERRA